MAADVVARIFVCVITHAAFDDVVAYERVVVHGHPLIELFAPDADLYQALCIGSNCTAFLQCKGQHTVFRHAPLLGDRKPLGSHVAGVGEIQYAFAFAEITRNIHMNVLYFQTPGRLVQHGTIDGQIVEHRIASHPERGLEPDLRAEIMDGKVFGDRRAAPFVKAVESGVAAMRWAVAHVTQAQQYGAQIDVSKVFVGNVMDPLNGGMPGFH